MHLIILFKSENQLKGSRRRKGRTTVYAHHLVWWAYRLLPKGRQTPNFPWRGKFAIMIVLPHSTRKGRWGLEGWYCKWRLKRKGNNKTGEGMSGNRNKNILKQRILVVKELRCSSGKNGITKSGNLIFKRKKKIEILWGSFEKDPTEKKKKNYTRKSTDKQKLGQRTLVGSMSKNISDMSCSTLPDNCCSIAMDKLQFSVVLRMWRRLILVVMSITVFKMFHFQHAISDNMLCLCWWLLFLCIFVAKVSFLLCCSLIKHFG